LLAEDPARDFMPSPGRLTEWDIPKGAGVRIDSAMFKGAMIPPYYDSMIGKLIVYGDDRAQAIERLEMALQDMRISGIGTNVPLLKAIARHPDIKANRIDTRWSERVLLPEFLSNIER
jgi:acetyl-CoA carboxylase biotin carboxylase subunit